MVYIIDVTSSPFRSVHAILKAQPASRLAAAVAVIRKEVGWRYNSQKDNSLSGVLKASRLQFIDRYTCFLRGNARSAKTNVVLFEKYRGSLEKVPW